MVSLFVEHNMGWMHGSSGAPYLSPRAVCHCLKVKVFYHGAGFFSWTVPSYLDRLTSTMVNHPQDTQELRIPVSWSPRETLHKKEVQYYFPIEYTVNTYRDIVDMISSVVGSTLRVRG